MVIVKKERKRGKEKKIKENKNQKQKLLGTSREYAQSSTHALARSLDAHFYALCVRAVTHAHSHTCSREEKGNKERALVSCGAAVAAPLVSVPSLVPSLSHSRLVSWETITATRARNPIATASGRA
jgi:hypothetical protein